MYLSNAVFLNYFYELIKQKNSKDKRLALEAKNLLEYLKLRGIEI